MTAYFVAIRQATTDAAELALYAGKAGPSLAGHPATPIVAYGKIEILEGDPVEGALILAFPSVDEARRWYDGEAYRDAVAHRFRGARYTAFLIEGVGA